MFSQFPTGPRHTEPNHCSRQIFHCGYSYILHPRLAFGCTYSVTQQILGQNSALAGTIFLQDLIFGSPPFPLKTSDHYTGM
jgi:hypothetical protein